MLLNCVSLISIVKLLIVNQVTHSFNEENANYLTWSKQHSKIKGLSTVQGDVGNDTLLSC